MGRGSSSSEAVEATTPGEFVPLVVRLPTSLRDPGGGCGLRDTTSVVAGDETAISEKLAGGQ